MKWGATTLTAVLVILGILGSAHAGAPEGLRAYKDGDYETALTELLPEAEAGNPEAQLLVGTMLQSGRVRLPGGPSGIEWIEKASNAGYPPAQTLFGTMILRGAVGTNSNTRREVIDNAKWVLQQAASQGYKPAIVQLGRIYTSLTRDSYSLKWLEEAAKLGDYQAQAMAALHYYGAGEWAPSNYQKSAYWAKKAAEANHPAAIRTLAFLHYDGKGVEKDRRTYVELITRAAELGDAKAALALSSSYEKGLSDTRGVILQRDARVARQWKQRSVDLGMKDVEVGQAGSGQSGADVDPRTALLSFALLLALMAGTGDEARGVQDAGIDPTQGLQDAALEGLQNIN